MKYKGNLQKGLASEINTVGCIIEANIGTPLPTPPSVALSTFRKSQRPTVSIPTSGDSRNMAPPPETYWLNKLTPHVPNSPLPVLIYRAALPPSSTATTIRSALEANNWIQGGVFKHYPAHHFHSVTHECYAVFNGSSRLLLGR